MASWILSNINIKNLNPAASVRNLIMGSGWIFHQNNNPIQTSKSTPEWVTEHWSDIHIPVIWPEPYRKWVSELKRSTWSCESEGSGVILDEGTVSDLLSGVLHLFRHYRRKLRTVILGKGCCNNWVPIMVANIEKAFISQCAPHFQSIYFNDR